MKIKQIKFAFFWDAWDWRWGKAMPSSVRFIELGPLMITVVYA